MAARIKELEAKFEEAKRKGGNFEKESADWKSIADQATSQLGKARQWRDKMLDSLNKIAKGKGSVAKLILEMQGGTAQQKSAGTSPAKVAVVNTGAPQQYEVQQELQQQLLWQQKAEEQQWEMEQQRLLEQQQLQHFQLQQANYINAIVQQGGLQRYSENGGYYNEGHCDYDYDDGHVQCDRW